MTTNTTSWEQVSASFEQLGTHIRSRFERAGADVAADRAAVEAAVQALVGAIEDAFGSAGKLVRDPLLRKDMTELAVTVRRALVGMLEQQTSAVKQVAGSSRPLRALRQEAAPARKAPSRSTTTTTRKPAARRAAKPRQTTH